MIWHEVRDLNDTSSWAVVAKQRVWQVGLSVRIDKGDSRPVAAELRQECLGDCEREESGAVGLSDGRVGEVLRSKEAS